MTNTTDRPNLSTMTPFERQAYFSAATPKITMPDRPTDRSRNGQRTPRSVKHRAHR